jgi:hypothetical protein
MACELPCQSRLRRGCDRIPYRPHFKLTLDLGCFFSFFVIQQQLYIVAFHMSGYYLSLTQ